MGQEIDRSGFTPEDFAQFAQRLREETELLRQMIADQALADSEPSIGLELEAWLVDAQLRPSPAIAELMAVHQDPLLVPELARFNLELNSTPLPLSGSPFSRMYGELDATWRACDQAAQTIGRRLVMIGTLPTATVGDFCLANMAPLHRYHALNARIMAERDHRPLRIRIEGRDRLSMERQDVMLEAATTAFQLHLKIPVALAGRVFNAAKILSAPMVAAGANSPFLFGSRLWDETRIPLFEQAIEIGRSELTRRVDFGIRYVHSCISEVFQANLHRYPVLLPGLGDTPPERFAHLALHNGTIWRWNRPIIGFEDDGTPHLRIEHRVLPSGPSSVDLIANAALFYGLVVELAHAKEPPEQQLPFDQCRANFYAAARHSLDGEVRWLDQRDHRLIDLLRDQLLPLARLGLQRLQLDPPEIDHWLGIIRRRLDAGINGSRWQQAWVEHHGRDLRGLTEACMLGQASGRPLHEWPLD